MDGSHWWIIIKLTLNGKQCFAFGSGVTSEEHLATHYFDRNDAEEEARKLFNHLRAEKVEVIVKRETAVWAAARQGHSR